MKKIIIMILFSSNISFANEEQDREFLDDCWIEVQVLFQFIGRANQGDQLPLKLFKNKQVRCLGKQERFEKKYSKKYVKPAANAEGIFFREFYSGK